jgi:ATP synthase protein I
VSAIDLPHARRLAFGVVLGQAAVTVLAAACAFAWAGRLSAVSALLGGGIATVGSLAMAGLVFGGTASAGAQRALSMFYIGEAVKIVVVVVLFVAVLRTIRVAALPMFAAFTATFLVYWIALLRALPALNRVRAAAPEQGVDG